MITISRLVMTNTKTLETGRVPRRSTSEIPILEPEEVGEILERAEHPRDACLVALLYLMGRRIGEVLPLRKADFTLSDPRVITVKTFNEKSFRRKRTSRFNVEKHDDYIYVEKFSDGTKTRTPYTTRYYEAIEPSYNRGGVSGAILSHYVEKHLEVLEDTDYLFPPHRRSPRDFINQPRAYQILRALDERLWLHALRHMDFTRMARLYKDDPVAMHRLTFHKQFESTLEYIHTEEDKGDRLAKL